MASQGGLRRTRGRDHFSRAGIEEGSNRQLYDNRTGGGRVRGGRADAGRKVKWRKANESIISRMGRGVKEGCLSNW